MELQERAQRSPRKQYHKFLCCCMMPVIPSESTPVLEEPKPKPKPKPKPASEPGIEKLLQCLDELQTSINAEQSDFIFLRELFQSNEFQSLLKVHEKVSDYENQNEARVPQGENGFSLAVDVSEDLEYQGDTKNAKELLRLLSQPHMRALLHAHDQVAAKDYLPHLPDVPDEVDEDEESVKIVRLMKTNEPLGATIRVNDTGTIKIARIMHGGAADRSGLVNIGDEVTEVNGVSVKGKEPTDIVGILAHINGPITLKLVPGDNDNKYFRESKMRVRAHFDFAPLDDPHVPCREAGLAFNRGDILHIVSQDDPHWWQARREGDRNMRAGLIPGRLLQERRMVAKETTTDKEIKTCSPLFTPKCTPKFSPRLPKKPKKTKKIMYHAQKNEDFDAEEIVTYEEVELCHQKEGMFRPIVLIGSPGVGRNELKRRLIESNPSHFKPCLPHTCRPKKVNEVDGEEYIFVTRQDMEKDIQSNKFIEHGEFRNNLYGTSMGAIKSVLNAGAVCVVCPHPQSLKKIRTRELKPYVIFVKPPSLEKLKETRGNENARSSFDENNARPFTDEEFQEMLSNSAKIESTYGHYFDYVITNEDVGVAFNDLVQEVREIEHESRWVPANWVR